MAAAAVAAAAQLVPQATNCTEAFGWMPCSTNVWGGLFLALVYGYAVLRGAMMIGDGGEWLMELKLAPAVIGGLVLPIIGALPDALIIINTGLRNSRSEAREEISVGMGTLAGSTVMLLTIVWGGSVLCGRCDLDEASGMQRDKRRTRPWWDLMATGVSTDAQTPRCAWAMLATAGLYLVVQIPALFIAHPKRAPDVSLVGCILCFISLAVYCGYQVITPGAQRRRSLAMHKHALRFRAVRSFSFAAQRFGGLLGDDGAVRRDVTSKLFHKFRRDEAGCLDASDVRSMLIGLEIAKPHWGRSNPSAAALGLAHAHSGGGGGGPDSSGGSSSGGSVNGTSGARRGGGGDDGRALDEHVALWMREFDPQGVGHITEDMFHEGVQRWVAYKLRACPLRETPKFMKHAARDPAAATQQLLVHVDDSTVPLLAADFYSDDLVEPCTEGSDLECGGSDADSGLSKEEVELTPLQIGLRAGALLAGGAALCGVFADPLVGTVTDISRASGIHPFFISFLFMPLASNASELVSSLAFASSRTSNHISVTFNQVYGAVVMNSTLCLGCFLAIIYSKRLPWTFPSEVLVILLPTLLLGFFAARRRSWPAAWGAAALAMYPLVLLMQYVLMRLMPQRQ